MADGTATHGWRRWLASILLAALAVAAYLPGLPGEFILDDQENLLPVARAVHGEIDPWSAITANRSGPLHRPVAMATFVANGFATGLQAGGFKAVNIALHALGALLLAALARLWFAQVMDPARARVLGWWTAAAWALLPLSVSTVLYVVQRMTQLSAVFVFAGLLAFTHARLAHGTRREVLLLFAGVPLALAAAAFSKESGLLLPLLALAVEITVLARTPATRASRVFFALLLWLPAAVGVAAFALHPEWLVSGYAAREYGPAQRLATEAIVLFQYLRDIVVPFGPGMGLIHDDVQAVAGLFDPPGAALAVVAWIAIVALALALRRRAPIAALGVLFFLGGHALESTIIPLELYFEHRNYLPAAGVMLVLVAAFDALRSRASSPAVARIAVFLACAYVALLGIATLGRARVWSSFDLLLLQEARHGTASPRLESMLAARAMERGDLAGALAHIDSAERLMPAPRRAVADVWRLLAYCVTKVDPPSALGTTIDRRAPRPIAVNGSVGFSQLVERQSAGACPAVPSEWSVRLGERWLHDAIDARQASHFWRFEYYLAMASVDAGHTERALVWSQRAWADSDGQQLVGLMVVRLQATLGRVDEARETLAILRARDDGSDHVVSENLAAFEQQLEELPGAAKKRE